MGLRTMWMRGASRAVFGLAAVVGLALFPAPAQADTVTNGPLLDSSARTFDSLTGGTTTPLPAGFELGIHADISPDGSAIAYVQFGNVKVRHANGSTDTLGQSPANMSISFLSYAGGSGQYVVAVAEDFNAGAPEVWRYQSGAAPVKVATLTDDGSRGMYAADAHATRLVYTRSDFDLGEVNTDTGTTSALTDYCTATAPGEADCTKGGGTTVDLAVDINPADGRILVDYSQLDEFTDFNGFGWLTPGSPPIPIYDPGASYVVDGLASPDGTKIAMTINDGFGNESNVVRSATDGTPLGTVVGHHEAWQPCPAGVCPAFIGNTVPGAPKIGTAKPGATDTEVTASVAWGTAASGGSPVTNYQVDVARLRADGSIAAHAYLTGPATARRATFWLLATRYEFRVRAKNALGWGAWSAYSNIVRAR